MLVRVKNLDWQSEPFVIPDNILDAWREIGRQGESAYDAWQSHLDASDKQIKIQFNQSQSDDLPDNFVQIITEVKQKWTEEKPDWPTRKASGEVLGRLTPHMPKLIGGSADLTGSNLTKTSDQVPIHAKDFSGSYIYYGVREHAMAAAMNGIALHKGFISLTVVRFLVFTDYCRPSIRLSALMKQRVIYVMTHDSIGLGEDGPTHQPVEHLSSLRAMPNCYVYRPADAIETLECWQLALECKDAPAILALTRQGVPTLREKFQAENQCQKGAYILSEATSKLDVTIFGTGSELSLAVKAKQKLEQDNIGVRVVSVPSVEHFKQQNKEYKVSLLCNDSIKVAVEAAARYGWEQFIGSHGIFIGMNGFGESAPAIDLYKHFGITTDAIVQAVKDRIAEKAQKQAS